MLTYCSSGNRATFVRAGENAAPPARTPPPAGALHVQPRGPRAPLSPAPTAGWRLATPGPVVHSTRGLAKTNQRTFRVYVQTGPWGLGGWVGPVVHEFKP